MDPGNIEHKAGIKPWMGIFLGSSQRTCRTPVVLVIAQWLRHWATDLRVVSSNSSQAAPVSPRARTSTLRRFGENHLADEVNINPHRHE